MRILDIVLALAIALLVAVSATAAPAPGSWGRDLVAGVPPQACRDGSFQLAAPGGVTYTVEWSRMCVPGKAPRVWMKRDIDQEVVFSAQVEAGLVVQRADADGDGLADLVFRHKSYSPTGPVITVDAVLMKTGETATYSRPESLSGGERFDGAARPKGARKVRKFLAGQAG